MSRSLAGVALLVLVAAAPIKEREPLEVGTQWKGTLTQKGKISGNEVPLKLEARLTVTRRDGARFEGELAETGNGIRLTYLVRGTVVRAKGGKGYAVSFKSYAARDAGSQTTTFLDIPYAGSLVGARLKGTWKHPANDDDTTLEGEFDFVLKP